MTISRLHLRISRRELLRGGAAGASALAATMLVGCRSSESGTAAIPSPTYPMATATTAAPIGISATWTRVVSSPGPAARRDHSLTFNPDDGRIYVFGGRATGVADNEFWAFDPAGNAWEQVTAEGAPEPRFAHNASYDHVGKQLLVALGQGNDGAFFNDVWAFRDGRWARMDAASEERPEIRYGAGGAHDAMGNRILISHGFTDRGRFDDTWAFDLAEGSWVPIATTGALPIKRCLTRCLWLAGSMLMFGGQTDGDPFLGDFWALDVGNGVWTELTDQRRPGPRNLYGASFDEAGDRWYVVGGNTPDGPTNETWAYDTKRSSWLQVVAAGETPSKRYSSDAAHAGGKLFVFGGHDGTAEIDDMWELTLAGT